MIEKQSASRVLEEDHLDVLEEIGRRERIDQEETIVDASDIEDDLSSVGSDDEVLLEDDDDA
jgi:hypothetical protein